MNYNELYKDFKIYKGKGKWRHIQAPTDELKKLQNKLLYDILYNIKTHKCAYGFIRGISIFDNALKHKDKEYIFTLDIKDFFDSITEQQIYKALINNNIDNEQATYISKVCTRYGVLVQGAPTSPQLSNIVFKPIDKKIFTLCNKLNLIYTRYADDVTISGKYEDIMAARPKIFSLINKAGFKIAYKKVETLGKHRQQNITGIVMNVEKSIPKRQVLKHRALLHNIERDIKEGKIKSYQDIKEQYIKFDKIYGYIQFMNQCNSKYKKYLNQAENIKKLLTT